MKIVQHLDGNPLNSTPTNLQITYQLICGDCGKTFISTFPTKTCPRCFAESDGPYDEEDIT